MDGQGEDQQLQRNDALRRITLQEGFEQQVRRVPERIAATCGEQSWTYRELNRHANRLAHRLRAQGVKRGDLVGICMDRTLHMVSGLLGILKAGAAYLPLDPSYPRDRLAFMVQDAQLRFLLTQEESRSALPAEILGALTVLDAGTVDAGEGKGAGWESDWPDPVSEIGPEDLAYVIYTSGSTGQPKGVQVVHRGLANFLHSMQCEPGLTEHDVVVALTTISFDIAGLELYLPLVTGARMVIADRQTAGDPQRLIALLEASQATFLQATPATWRMLLQAGWRRNAHLATALCGGEALSRELADQLLERVDRLWNVYGPTETTIWSMIARITQDSGRITLGVPIAQTHIHLLDPDLCPVPAGEVGELAIGGAGLALGYLHRPELTAQRFVVHPRTGERLYRTGDLARRSTHGHYEFLGRADHQVKIRGHRIELGEIEASLERHPAVDAAVVTVREEAEGDKRLVAYVVAHTEPSVPAEPPKHDAHWHSVWDDTYRRQANEDPTFNINGWNDSYTGLPLPAEHVREWVDHTVSTIRAQHPGRVLEIGCGTGLLLFRLAADCIQYCGTDISAEAVHYIDAQVRRLGHDWPQLSLVARAAHEFADVAPASFDTVVINSVIQYFPNAEYLIEVLEGAVGAVAEGGTVFVGDVRNLSLLAAFHTSVQVFQAAPELSIEQLRARVARRMEQEAGLLVDPSFFHALKSRIPRIGAVEIKVKRGHCQNELTRFRYDVVLHVSGQHGAQGAASDCEWLDWNEQLDQAAIANRLSAAPDRVFGIARIPNRRVFADVAAAGLLGRAESVAGLREAMAAVEGAGLHPEALYQLERDFPVSVHVTWSGSGADGYCDVVFVPHGRRGDFFRPAHPAAADAALHRTVNVPFRGQGAQPVIADLRAFLGKTLPHYMLPSHIVVLDSFPLTSSGKIDRKALPAPSQGRPDLLVPYAAARDRLEAELAAQWADLLGVEPVGIHDNFFELGGDSLLTVQLLGSINDSQCVDLTLADLFEHPTVAGLCGVVRHQQGDAAAGTGRAAVPEYLADVDLALSSADRLPDGGERWGQAPRHAFLTGATGFLGAHLLHELLRQTDATVSCLVRCANVQDGMGRIQANLQTHRLWDERFRPRIAVVKGDLEQERFGLSEADFDRLAAEVDTLYHNGAQVNLLYPYRALRKANVLGTREIIRLATRARLKPIQYVSSLAVFESAEYRDVPVIYETEDLGSGLGLTDGYAQSKFVAEKLLQRARADGVPVAIYRPGMISGHSGTGISNIGDMVCRMVKGFIELGSMPELDLAIDLVPVDYVSRAIVHLSTHALPLRPVFDLANAHPLRWDELTRNIRDWGYPVRQCSYGTWQDQLQQACRRNPNHVLAPLMPLFVDKLPGEDMTYLEASSMCGHGFDCTGTNTGLAATGIACPPAPELMPAYHAFFVQSGFLPASPNGGADQGRHLM
jgi:amino acid adenylation domain-containing protein/thioester reductase-like protein